MLRLNLACRRVAVMVLAFVMGVIFAAGRARAQSCPDPGDAVIFESTIYYFDFDPFGGGRTYVASYGPTRSSVTAPERRIGSLNPKLQVTNANASGASRSFSAQISNTVNLRAQRISGQIFGSGAEVRVKIYIQGPRGTPYYYQAVQSGQLSTAFPSLGRADSFGGGVICSSVNGGTSPNTVPINTDSGRVPGVTSLPEIVQDGHVYSYATELAFSVEGGILQSIDFCFPFGGCPTFDYRADGNLQVALEAGTTPPPCAATLSINPLGSCEFSGSRLQRRFEMIAQFQNSATTYCKCCRYEQLVRRVEGYFEYDVCMTNFSGISVCRRHRVYIENQNADGESLYGPCLVEDSKPSEPNSPCLGDLAYGSRTPQTQGCPFNENNRYLTGPVGQPDRENGCYFRGFDAPGFSNVPPSSFNTRITYRHYQLFEGRVIVNTAGGPECAWTGNPIVTRQRWTVCCTYEQGGTQNSTASSCAPFNGPVDNTVRVSTPFSLAGRRATLVAYRDGGLLRGAVVFSAVGNELFDQTSVGVTVTGGDDFLFPNNPLIQDSDGIRTSWMRPFAVGFTSCFPASAQVSVTLENQTAVVNIDLGLLAASLVSDVDDGSSTGTPDGGVGIEDLIYYITKYDAGDPVADVDDGNAFGLTDGGIGIEDLLYFLGRYERGC